MMAQIQVLVQAAFEAAPALPSRISEDMGRRRSLINGVDMLQVSDFLSEYMLRSEIRIYRDKLIALRDQGQLTGSNDLERHWISSLHFKTSDDLYTHVRTLSQSKLRELFDWVKQQETGGGSPPTDPTKSDGSVVAVDLVDMAFEALTQHQLVEFMAKTLA